MMASQWLSSAPFATPLATSRLKAAPLGNGCFLHSPFSMKDCPFGVSRGFKPINACFPNFDQEPILKEAFKEPVAFLGGVFAGLLRLDLSEDPLKEWVMAAAEASGMNEEDDAAGKGDETPLQIEIE